MARSRPVKLLTTPDNVWACKYTSSLFYYSRTAATALATKSLKWLFVIHLSIRIVSFSIFNFKLLQAHQCTQQEQHREYGISRRTWVLPVFHIIVVRTRYSFQAKKFFFLYLLRVLREHLRHDSLEIVQPEELIVAVFLSLAQGGGKRAASADWVLVSAVLVGMLRQDIATRQVTGKGDIDVEHHEVDVALTSALRSGDHLVLNELELSIRRKDLIWENVKNSVVGS